MLPVDVTLIKNHLISIYSSLLHIITEWEASGQGDSEFNAKAVEDLCKDSLPNAILVNEDGKGTELIGQNIGKS
jgi:hypothetical protein